MVKLWTEIETEMLETMYDHKRPVREIAEVLKRSNKSVVNKANTLGLGKINLLTEKEIQYIIDNYKNYNLKEIAKELNRTKSFVCRKAKKLGLDMNCKKKEITKGYIDNEGHYHKKGWKRKTEEEIKKNHKQSSLRMKEWHNTHEHPKGMLNKTHSKEYKQEISKRVIKYWENITEEEKEERRVKHVMTRIKNGTLSPQKFHKSPYSRTRGGKRADLDNTYFRSSWEANVARYYTYKNIKWEYEPKRFIFKDIKKGNISYMPDFYLPETDEWIEVKGWMDAQSKTKLKRFAKFFPDENSRLKLIMQKEYDVIKKEKAFIDNWEDK